MADTGAAVGATIDTLHEPRLVKLAGDNFLPDFLERHGRRGRRHDAASVPGRSRA